MAQTTEDKPKSRRRSVVADKAQNRKKIYDTQPKRVCVSCNKKITTNKFYRSLSEFTPDGFSPMCKDCFIAGCLDENKRIDMNKMRNMMRLINRPFLPMIVESSVKESENKAFKLNKDELITDQSYAVAIYMKNINSLVQYATLTYEKGLELELTQSAGTNIAVAAELGLKGYGIGVSNNGDKTEYKDDSQPYYLNANDDGFEVTTDIIRKFGEGYTKREYKSMMEKYDFLRQSYPEITNLHSESLITYVRYKVKEEIATADGDVDAAASWANLATKAAEKAKINPNQLSASDLQGGLNSFSELLMAVEQAVDIIPILPQFKQTPKDMPDFVMWCYINYIRDAEGKPLCSYEDVYHFYDQRKADYIREYGDPYHIFDDDESNKHRNDVERFITLPKEYGD